MSNKTSIAKKSPAEQGLEDLIELGGGEPAGQKGGGSTAAPAAAASSTGSATVDSYNEDEELEEMGGGARVEIFFVHKIKPGKAPRDNQLLIAEDDTFLGKYEGSFTSGKFDSRTHKITVTDGPWAGKTIGLPTAGVLDRKFQCVPKGTKTQVVFTGVNVIKGNHKYAGSESYSYNVSLPGSVKRAIEAGTLPASYELKVSN